MIHEENIVERILYKHVPEYINIIVEQILCKHTREH